MSCRVSLSYGCRVLFETAEFVLLRGSVTGLIGTNGSGKTSLANVIASKELPGFPKDMCIEYLSSHQSILSETDAVLTPERYLCSVVEKKIGVIQQEIEVLELNDTNNYDIMG